MNPALLLIIATTGLLSCKQGDKSTPQTVKTETVNSARKYVYADSMGKLLIIENGGPKGEGYTDPTGKEYFKTIFWTRITNETDNSLVLNINFPADSYELPSSPGKHFKILLPSDTMTFNNLNGHNHGLEDLESFLDNAIRKSASSRRTIHSKESSGFYVVILFDKGFGGPFRTGLSLKGQNLVYRISRFSGPSNSLTDEKEIDCGNINLKNLVLQK
ncbi:hypothetical protein F0P96_17785 [Hymenobacter busanensis]|uniref:Uncharacterized protein n=1 Tax=Hymenobacter busanensis TaxID=2607656 RepID=A0A7L5A2W6_9BACT|nr:hypothetical protein [Hymenobacter busanensis]KAA9327091.1 hypothetical protein F0P96_17785 [Hymenobacter busanensis]QHJ09543.1 hypothetical protein GUY19_20605 [Hymenobacter busanensis]